MSKAFVFLNCDLNSQGEVTRQMARVLGVTHVNELSGIYDIVAQLDAGSEEEIADTVRKLRSIANIRSSLTMVVSEKSEAKIREMTLH